MRFDTKAATYEAHAHIQRELAAWLAEWLEPALPDDAVILEVGAGTGLFTRELLELGRVEALDLSPAMVAEGRRRLPAADWRVGDGFRLRAGCCERLYSSALLQWAHDLAEVARNWFSALRPGGRMLHGVFVAPTLPELAALDGFVAPVCWRTTDEWLGAFAEAGFEIFRAEQTVCERVHVSAQALLRELHDTGVTPARARLSAGQLRRLLRDYERLHARPEGGVRATWSLLRFEAGKK